MNEFSEKENDILPGLSRRLKSALAGFRGMEVFIIVWLGQLVSLVGSGLTSFVLGLWVYQRTGSVTQFALIALSAVLPRLALSPLAGALVDRWDRRWAMILGDVGAGLSTSAVAILFYFNQLEVWHIYVAAAAGSAFGAIQGPAWTASVTLLVPGRHLGRANGMAQFGRAAAEILAPMLAGILFVTIHVWGIILIDFVTFLFAVVTLLIVRFPKPDATAEGKAGKGSLFREAGYGWKYIKARPGLLGLLFFFAVVNFLWGMVGALITPMILNFTSADMLGVIISTAGCGLLAGSVMMSLWGGPKRRIDGVLNFEALSGVCFLLIGLQPSVLLIAIGAFGAHLTIAVINGSNQAIWQSKVAPDVQGRVFAIQEMISRSTAPLAFLLAGPLADKLFEPLLAPGGALAETIGWITGVGPGRGIGALFLLMGVVKILVALGGYLYPRVRLVEEELPDMITDKPAAATTG